MFSLMDETWIPAIDVDGNQKLVGIRQIFSGEVKVISVQGESPAQNYAITRLLLAIFWRAHSIESKVRPGETFKFTSWFKFLRKKLLETGKDEVVLEYLEQYQDRFELFDPCKPFMQVAGLETASGEVKHVTTIVPEAQDDYFSMRAGKTRDFISFAEAARWLIYAQAYDYSGIKSGAVGDSRVKGRKGYPIGTGWTGMTGGVLVTGETLLDTLIMNTCEEALTNPNDRPVWERQPDGSDARDHVGEPAIPQGPADLATWQSRRIKLHVEGDRVTGVLVCNGDRIPDAGASFFGDTMTPYRFSVNKSKKDRDVYYPAAFSPQRTMWRALDALIISEADGGFSGKEKAPKRPRNLDNLAYLSQKIDGIPKVLNVELVAVEYGPQSSSVASTYAAQIGMPVIVLLEDSQQLRQIVRDTANATVEAAIALGRFAANLLVDAGNKDYEFTPMVNNQVLTEDQVLTGPELYFVKWLRKLADVTGDQVLTELEPYFNQWLRKLADVPPRLLGENNSESNELVLLVQEWQSTVRQSILDAAIVLLRGAGPKALAGREIRDKDTNRVTDVVSAGRHYQQLKRKLGALLPSATASEMNQSQLKEGNKHE